MYSFDWGYIWIILIQLVMVGVVVWLIVQWVKFFSKKKDTRTPHDIAKERYAKGEITKEELEEIKRNLK
jgi:putative membrane protein